jgi:glucose-6-phosphate dehydrogenase assembly protein OpcA
MEIDLMTTIGAELEKIWESPEASHKMRACLFNLIFYTEKTERTPYIHKIAQKVIDKFPSRVILITADKTSRENKIKTSVSLMSSTHPGYPIICDLIQLEVLGSQQARIPFIILPHILADLPVYLIWAEDPARENPLASQLEKIANRLIFDSECTDSLSRFAKALLHDRETFHCDVADLNWARGESWRDLLTETFYPEPMLEELKKTNKIQIEYNAQGTPFFCHTQIQALYLQGWLASQLGWQFEKIRKDKEKVYFSYKNGSDPVEVSLTPVSISNLPPGGVVSLDLETSSGLHCSFTHDQKIPLQVNVNVSHKERCEMPRHYLFARGDSGESLVKEICHKGTSAHYLKLLEQIAKMDV